MGSRASQSGVGLAASRVAVGYELSIVIDGPRYDTSTRARVILSKLIFWDGFKLLVVLVSATLISFQGRDEERCGVKKTKFIGGNRARKGGSGCDEWKLVLTLPSCTA